jgi:hypothetical protein
MSVRIYYLRDHENIRTRTDGSHTRGNPVACVVTEVDKKTGTIRYAVSTLHPPFLDKSGAVVTPRFDKLLSKRIATGRLTKKPTTLQGVPGSGHEITLKVMCHIADNTKAATLRNLAIDWVKAASKPRAAEFARSMGAQPPTHNIRA